MPNSLRDLLARACLRALSGAGVRDERDPANQLDAGLSPHLRWDRRVLLDPVQERSGQGRDQQRTRQGCADRGAEMVAVFCSQPTSGFLSIRNWKKNITRPPVSSSVHACGECREQPAAGGGPGDP